VAVVTRAQALWLCLEGRPLARFTVALGFGGVDKRERGDARTPLGVYPLGDPRPSRRYRTSIPIGYPTKEQVARGFAGGHVGIHGPDCLRARAPAAFGDWTLGMHRHRDLRGPGPDRLLRPGAQAGRRDLS
jgi:L,D-transpeptidase catalytic domain